MRHVYNSLLKTAIYRISVALVSFAVLWSLTGDFVWGGWLALCVEAANAAWFFIFDILWERYKKHKSPKDPLTTNHTSLSREGGDHDVIGCFPSNAGWLANRSPPARGRELAVEHKHQLQPAGEGMARSPGPIARLARPLCFSNQHPVGQCISPSSRAGQAGVM